MRRSAARPTTLELSRARLTATPSPIDVLGTPSGAVLGLAVTYTATCRGAAVRQSPALEVADVLLAHGARYARNHSLGPEQQRAMRDIVRCRTAALGGHLDRCTACGDEQPAYITCRNRHCPKCLDGY